MGSPLRRRSTAVVIVGTTALARHLTVRRVTGVIVRGLIGVTARGRVTDTG